jgi:hypothetical protein
MTAMASSVIGFGAVPTAVAEDGSNFLAFGLSRLVASDSRRRRCDGGTQFRGGFLELL